MYMLGYLRVYALYYYTKRKIVQYFLLSMKSILILKEVLLFIFLMAFRYYFLFKCISKKGVDFRKKLFFFKKSVNPRFFACKYIDLLQVYGKRLVVITSLNTTTSFIIKIFITYFNKLVILFISTNKTE